MVETLTTPAPAPLFALTGPTAAGKSAVALACARALGGEIISCDSVQLYCGFDVGSAKPSAAERAEVPHHLVDARTWDAPFDAKAFVDAAVAAAAAIRGRGRVPIVCGGTGLYLRALTHGLVDVPTDAALRATLQARATRELPALWAELQARDPQGAAAIAPTNPAYVVRALEICLLTGRPASVVRAEQARAAAASPTRPRVRLVALDGPTPWLRARIDARSHAMVAAGLLAEVQALRDQGVAPGCAPMRAVGYREANQVLDGTLPAEALAAAVAQSTWAYARRQRTWLRRSPPDAYVAGDAAPAAVTAAVLEAWQGDAAAAAKTPG